MNPEEDDEENEKSIWKFEKITTRWWFYFKNILLFYLFCGAQYIDHATNITYLKISGLLFDKISTEMLQNWNSST